MFTDIQTVIYTIDGITAYFERYEDQEFQKVHFLPEINYYLFWDWRKKVIVRSKVDRDCCIDEIKIMIINFEREPSTKYVIHDLRGTV